MSHRCLHITRFFRGLTTQEEKSSIQWQQFMFNCQQSRARGKQTMHWNRNGCKEMRHCMCPSGRHTDHRHTRTNVPTSLRTFIRTSTYTRTRAVWTNQLITMKGYRTSSSYCVDDIARLSVVGGTHRDRTITKYDRTPAAKLFCPPVICDTHEIRCLCQVGLYSRRTYVNNMFFTVKSHFCYGILWCRLSLDMPHFGDGNPYF